MGEKLRERLTMKSEQETRDFGRKLALNLRAGDVVALTGDLGAGKTALTKAIAEGLGVTEMITSPTFTIVCEYHSGRLPLYHFDVYRVSDPDELFEIGYEEYFFGQGVSVVEWADLIEDLLPRETISIYIAYGEGLTEREYEITWPETRELVL